MGAPVCDREAQLMLEAWGLANRVGGPKGYPRIAPFIPQARGISLEWSDHKIDIVGWVVHQLDDDERVIVKLYFEPQASGKRLTVNAISKKISLHHKLIHRALDRCVGRVAQALAVPQYFKFENKP